MSKNKIGVIGNGFVGSNFCFSSVADMYVFDTDPSRCLNDIESVYNCTLVYVYLLQCLQMDHKIYLMLKAHLKRLKMDPYIY